MHLLWCLGDTRTPRMQVRRPQWTTAAIVYIVSKNAFRYTIRLAACMRASTHYGSYVVIFCFDCLTDSLPGASVWFSSFFRVSSMD